MIAVEMLDAALLRMGAQMRVLMWTGREDHAHHVAEMTRLRGGDTRATEAWQEICAMRRAYWRGVATGT